MTPQEFAAKVDWEGSVHAAISDYGLSEKYLSRDDDPVLYDLVREYASYAVVLRDLEREIEDRIEELMEG